MKTNLLTWAKRAIPALAMAGMALTACEKEPLEKKPAYRAPYEKELRFNNRNIDSIAMPIVQHFVHDTACAHIYLTVTDDNNFTIYTSEEITKYLRNNLGDLIDLAPNKISGRGDFFFERGAVSVQDSLWFVQNGWTICQMANHR